MMKNIHLTVNEKLDLFGDRRPCIGIDFDGTIADSAPFPEIGKIKEGARECIDEFVKNGWKVMIHTSRTGNAQDAIVDFLVENDIKFTSINFNRDCPMASQKPMCDIYLDNRGMHFNESNKDEWWNIYQRCVAMVRKLGSHKYIP